MSSVEIKIKGVKSVRRGKPRAKRGKRKNKAGLLEKTKMPEYSYRGLPYNYVSPPQPTYIDRPAPLIQQQQQPAIDYKPMVDSLTQQLALARLKEKSAEEQNIIPPKDYTPMDIRLASSQTPSSFDPLNHPPAMPSHYPKHIEEVRGVPGFQGNVGDIITTDKGKVMKVVDEFKTPAATVKKPAVRKSAPKKKDNE